MITKFIEHSKLSTAKKIDGMAVGTVTFLSFYLQDYAKHCLDINRQTFSKYLANKDLAHSTKAVIASGLGRFFLYEKLITAEDYKILKESFRLPVNSWSTQHLTDEDVQKIIYECYRGKTALNRKRNACLVAMLSTIGARISQLCELDTDDVFITETNVQITLVKKKERKVNLQKNLDIKIVPYNYHLGIYVFGDIVSKYSVERSSYPGEAFFISHQSNRLFINTAEKIVKSLGNDVGLDIHPHTFRHYVGSKICGSGSIHKAAMMLGHKNISTTQKYINPDVMEGAYG